MTISKLKMTATIAIGVALAGSLPFVTRAQNHARRTPRASAASVPVPKNVMRLFDRAAKAESGVQTGRLSLNYVGTPESEKSVVAFDNRRQIVMVHGTQNPTQNQFRIRFSPDAYQTFTHYPTSARTADDVNTSKQEGYWPPTWPYGVLRGRQWQAWRSMVISGRLKAVIVSSDPITSLTKIRLIGGPTDEFDQQLLVDSRHGYTLTGLQLLDKATGRSVSGYTIKYRPYGGQWYPEMIERRPQGRRRLSRAEKWTVSEAEIDPPLLDSDLSFGSVPEGTRRHYYSRSGEPAQAK